MPISHTRDVDPRIRILSCEAPEPSRRQLDWRLPVAAVAVAGLGIGITLAVTSHTAAPTLTGDSGPVPAAAGPAAAVPVPQVDVLASVNAASIRPTHYLHAALRDAVSADFRAAANRAVTVLPAVQSAPQTARTPVTTGGSTTTASVPNRVTNGPETSASGQNSTSGTPQNAATGAVVEPSTTGTGSAPKAVGPEQAPGSGDPSTPQ